VTPPARQGSRRSVLFAVFLEALFARTHTHTHVHSTHTHTRTYTHTHAHVCTQTTSGFSKTCIS
jgi:hypothetical protein